MDQQSIKQTTSPRNTLRTIKATVDFCPAAFGSVLFEAGRTKVICAASISESVPDHAAKKNTGWLTAEYSMLPYSTERRTDRPLIKRDGRAVEIQRLIGRSLRGMIDLTKIPGYTITVDCDVLQADGGTRTASITGGAIALARAVKRMLAEGLISEDPLTCYVAAVSAGYVDGKPVLDLDYPLDSRADVDMNVVMDSRGGLIEVQGTGEKSTFTRQQLNEMLDLAARGIEELFEVQKGVIE
jgi:ribonuclease PH